MSNPQEDKEDQQQQVASHRDDFEAHGEEKEKGEEQKPPRRDMLCLEDLFHQQVEFSSPDQTFDLTPRTKEALERNGISSLEHLMKRDLASFWRENLDVRLQRLQYESHERRRQELFKLASEERQRLVDADTSTCISFSGTPGQRLSAAEVIEAQERATASLVEIEKRRLEKAKRRQRKELIQTLQFEQKMQAIQAELLDREEKDARMEEERLRQKKIRERRNAEEKRIRELRRKEALAREEERARAAQHEQFEKEQQIKMLKARNVAEAKARARIQQHERERKAQMHRLQTQRVLEARRLEAEEKMKERMHAERERNQKRERHMQIEEKQRGETGIPSRNCLIVRHALSCSYSYTH